MTKIPDRRGADRGQRRNPNQGRRKTGDKDRIPEELGEVTREASLERSEQRGDGSPSPDGRRRRERTRTAECRQAHRQR